MTSVVLVSEVAAVLHCGTLPSMNDRKRKEEGIGGGGVETPPIYFLLAISF